MGMRATVRKGHLVLDEPTDLPEGAVLDLVIDDEGDELDERERAALDDAIARSVEDADRGRSSAADVVLARLRARRAT